MRFALLLAALAVAPASAQPTFRLSIGADADRLADVRRSQDATLEVLRRDVGVSAEATDTFPPFLSVHADLSAPFDRGVAAGVEVGFSSTGGRVDYRDASGAYRYDQVVRRTFVGVLLDVAAGEWGGVSLSGTVRNRLTLGRIEAEERLALAGRPEDGNRSVGEQVSSSVYAGGAAEVGLGGPLRLRASAGWEQTVGGGLSYEYQGGTAPVSGFFPPDLIDWSGPRVGVGLAARFGGGDR